MPAAGRVGDKARCPADAHGCPGCAHGVVGPAVQGSPDVLVNGRAALRVGDPGVHAACCGPNTWKAAEGSATVFVNGKAFHRLGDKTTHCGGEGQLVEGSPDVIVGGEAPPPPPATMVVGPTEHKLDVVFRDRDGKIVANLPVVVVLPGGEQRKMTSDHEGRILVLGVDPGQCEVRVDRAWVRGGK